MQDFTEVIDLYLTMDTSYAAMINGPWGSGKTYFVKTTLLPRIEATPLSGNAAKHYKAVLVSLFGQKSIDDVQATILLSLIPFAGNKYAKLGSNLLKGLFRGALKLGGLEGFGDVASGTNIDPKDWIDFEELVLIFDDLERRHPSLSLEEVLGFINSLVEAGNNKVLLITNEKGPTDTTYHDLKEKTVGISIYFKPDFKASVNNIIGTRFAGFPAYRTYLQNHLATITDNFLRHSKNLRVLTFWLSYYQFLFSQVDDVLSGIPPLESKRDVILSDLFYFSMAIAIEYRDGNIGFGERAGLDRENYMSLPEKFAEKASHQNKAENKAVTKLYYHHFADTYYRDHPYFFYDSVFNLITGGGKLRTDHLCRELKEQYHVSDTEIPPHYVRFAVLGYPEVFVLDDNTYLGLTRQLLQDAENGAFDQDSYPTVFHYVMRFNSPLGLEPGEVADRIITGIRQGQSHYEYIPGLDVQLRPSANNEHPAYHAQVVAACNTANINAQRIRTGQVIADLRASFFQDFSAFYNAMSDNEQGLDVLPFFDRFPADEVAQHLATLPNSSLLQFTAIVKNRKKNANSPQFAVERPFFTELANRLTHNPDWLSGKGLRWSNLTDLRDTILDYVNYLPEHLSNNPK